jgi:CheY-like chemotaxis protein
MNNLTGPQQFRPLNDLATANATNVTSTDATRISSPMASASAAPPGSPPSRTEFSVGSIRATPSVMGEPQMTQEIIQVAMIDDHRLVTETLAARLSRETGISVVGTAHDGDSGLKMVLETRPDVVVLDVNFPGKSAFEIGQEISSQLPMARVVFLTGFLSDIFIEQALRNRNTRGYVLKENRSDVFVRVVRRGLPANSLFRRM